MQILYPLAVLQIDPLKADSILADPEVIKAIADKRRENPDFLVFQEGFSSTLELAKAKKNGTYILTVHTTYIHTYIHTYTYF